MTGSQRHAGDIDQFLLDLAIHLKDLTSSLNWMASFRPNAGKPDARAPSPALKRQSLKTATP
jgi:hypothetical protein